MAALREVLDTTVNRRLRATSAKITNALTMVQEVFSQVEHSIGGNLTVSQTAWHVTGEKGRNTLFWSRQGSTDRLLSVTYEVVPVGEELLLRLEGETVYRTDLAEPEYGDRFQTAVKAWLAARLRAVLSAPNALP